MFIRSDNYSQMTKKRKHNFIQTKRDIKFEPRNVCIQNIKRKTFHCTVHNIPYAVTIRPCMIKCSDETMLDKHITLSVQISVSVKDAII